MGGIMLGCRRLWLFGFYGLCCVLWIAGAYFYYESNHVRSPMIPPQQRVALAPIKRSLKLPFKTWGEALKAHAAEVGLEHLSFRFRRTKGGERGWQVNLILRAEEEERLLAFLKASKALLASHLQLQHLLMKAEEPEQGDGDGTVMLEVRCTFG